MKKPSISIAASLLCLLISGIALTNSPCYADENVLVIWPDQANLKPDAGENLVVRQKKNGPDPAVFKVQVPTLTVHLPDPKIATGAAVIVCPGGGYQMVVIEKEGHAIARWLNSMGIAAFVLKYRLPDATRADAADPLSLQDVRRAMRIVRSRAKEFNLQPDRIGVCGSSAGGHLAATISTHFDAGDPKAKDAVDRVSCRPDFSILLYPVISMDKEITHSGSRDSLLGKTPSDDRVRLFSNELQVTSQTPPAFLVHASDDKVVPPENSIRYYQALLRAGVPAEMHLFEKGGHGFALVNKTGGTALWPPLCQEWLAGIGCAKPVNP